MEFAEQLIRNSMEDPKQRERKRREHLSIPSALTGTSKCPTPVAAPIPTTTSPLIPSTSKIKSDRRS
ncbi:hypothetical protein SUGI_0058780 [Cryptomeria japonica]|nr:hypothetical protein SUGI_0058780 [Cryptomeria japonica]